ncbi:hypothetical protein PTKIN_Ptkin01aG0025100 [Pterospermum kingtungense]
MASDYCFKIRQEIDNRLDQLCSWIPYDLFKIVLDFCYVSPLNLETTLERHHQSVVYPRDVFLSEEHGPNIVISMFSDTGASPEFLRNVVVPDILSFAWETDTDPVNLGRKTIKLVVEILVLPSVDHPVAIEESLSTLNFKPASRSSIRSLKRVKLGDEEGLLPFKKRRRFEGSSSKKQCTICFDDFSNGDEAASMPCGHVYHGGCIVRWLETSNSCPLCRYQMPN